MSSQMSIEEQCRKLAEAIKTGSIGQVKQLVDAGTSGGVDLVNSNCRVGRCRLTILGKAVVEASDPEVVQFLLEKASNGANSWVTTSNCLPNHADINIPLLHLAAYAGNITALTVLCNENAWPINLDETTSSLCAITGLVTLTSRNLQRRIPNSLPFFHPEVRNEGVTALHCAAFAGHPKAVGTLVEAIKRRAQGHPGKLYALNAVDDHLMSPLHYATIRGDVASVCELLASSPMVLGTQEELDRGLTPLDMVDILIQLKEELLLQEGPSQAMVDILIQLKEDLLLQEGPSQAFSIEDKYFLNDLKGIKLALLGRPDVKRYIQNLYKDREVFVYCINAILVGAALMAGITFAGWLQPPLGYSPYYEPQYQITESGAPPGTYEPYAAVERSVTLRVFWIFNSFSFFLAIAGLLTGAGAVLPSQQKFIKVEVQHIRTLLIRTSLVLIASIVCAIGAFTAAGFACLPPTLKYQWLMVMTAALGVLLCLCVLWHYLKRLFRLFCFESLATARGITGKLFHVWEVSLADSGGRGYRLWK